MAERLIKRLEHHERLTVGARSWLERLSAASFVVGPNEDIVSEGARSPTGHIVLDGLAGTYKLLHDGSRQIFHFMLPGDSCDMHRHILGWRDNSVVAFVRSRVARLTPDEMDEIARDHPGLARAFWWAMLCDQAIMRERMISLGRRTAERRIAHIFCELRVRMDAVSLVEREGDAVSYAFPVTQPELADAVGLTAVHVNRTLQQLRDADLVSFRSRRVVILDEPRLATLAGFDPRYLHLEG